MDTHVSIVMEGMVTRSRPEGSSIEYSPHKPPSSFEIALDLVLSPSNLVELAYQDAFAGFAVCTLS
jgi:hypothetical protein